MLAWWTRRKSRSQLWRIQLPIAGLVLTTEALIHEIPQDLSEDELAAMDAAAGMGGMDYAVDFKIPLPGAGWLFILASWRVDGVALSQPWRRGWRRGDGVEDGVARRSRAAGVVFVGARRPRAPMLRVWGCPEDCDASAQARTRGTRGRSAEPEPQRLCYSRARLLAQKPRLGRIASHSYLSTEAKRAKS